MNRIVMNALGLFPFALYVLFFTSLATRASEYGQAMGLRPIRIMDYEAGMGLHRRTSEEFSDLNLQTQLELVYGTSGGM